MPSKTSSGKTRTKSIKLDLACGQDKQAGFVGVDIGGDADVQHDLLDFPWPFEDGSVSEAHCSHFVEHIPHTDPRWSSTEDGFFLFFDELYRVMKKDASVTIEHPYGQHQRALWDPTHVRYIVETTWYYLSAEWREINKLSHYNVSCNFEIINIDAVGVDDDFLSRSSDQQQFQSKYYWNVIPDLKVILKKR